MFSKVFGLLTPEFKVQFLARQAGLSDGDLAKLNDTLRRASALPGVSALLGGRDLSLTNLVTIVSSPEPYRAAGAMLPMIQSLIATDDGAAAVAQAAETFVTNDPNGELIATLLSKVSKLPIVGFGDVEHEGVGDFLQRAIFPLLRSRAPIAEASATAPFTCRYCGHVDHIDVIQHDHFVHKCSGCEQTQLVNVIQG